VDIKTNNWVRAAATTDFPASNMLSVELAGQTIAIYRLEDGEFYATDGICTHQDACLTDGWLEDGEIECPLHAGRFDVRTGKGRGEPITRDLRTYRVQVNNGDIEIDIGSLPAKA
jgi:MocE subfamily Rieske [2Fe-2S] domain protein